MAFPTASATWSTGEENEDGDVVPAHPLMHFCGGKNQTSACINLYWALIMAQLKKWLLPTLEDLGSNPPSQFY